MTQTNGPLAELELLNRLGIESWRNLSKDKVMTFVSDLPNLDKDVALKVVAQFPDFKALVLDSLDQVQNDVSQARSFNWKSQKKVHKAFDGYRRVLERELDRENLTSEERLGILHLFRDAVDAEAAKDTENKQFQATLTGVLSLAVVALVGAAVAVLGGTTQVGGDSRRSA